MRDEEISHSPCVGFDRATAFALLHFIASSVVFVLVVLEQIAKYLDSVGKPALWQAIRDLHAESVAQILIIVSFVAFAAAYIWDPFRQNSSNRAMERTPHQPGVAFH
jgi:hypothetical protein